MNHEPNMPLTPANMTGDYTPPTQPPAPLAGGTELRPSTAPAEVAAGCKEGRPVSPATGEREAELRAAIVNAINVHRGAYPELVPGVDPVRYHGYLTVRLLAALTPLLDRREGELETAKFATHQHQQYAHMMQEQRSAIAKAYNKMEGELADKDAEIATAHAHMDKLREHRNDLDAACHELEGKLGAAKKDFDDLWVREATAKMQLVEAQTALRESEAARTTAQEIIESLQDEIRELGERD